MRGAEKLKSSELESSAEDLRKCFVDYLVGVGEKPNWQNEEQEDAFLSEIANSLDARKGLREELADFTASPEGMSFVEDSVAKYICGERGSMSLREDVLCFLVRDVVDEKWATFLAQKRPDIYKVDIDNVKKDIIKDVASLLTAPDGEGLVWDTTLYDALPEGAIDFAHLDVEKITPVMEKFVNVVSEKIGLEKAPAIEVSVSDDERDTIYCCNTGRSSTERAAISVDVNSHSSLAEIADAVGHELWHQRQNNDKDYDGGDLAQRLYINKAFYIRSEVDHNLHRSQLSEMQAWYVGEQLGAFFRERYLDRHPEKIAEMAEMYTRIENGEYSPAKREDGLDAAYYWSARNRLVRRTTSGSASAV